MRLVRFPTPANMPEHAGTDIDFHGKAGTRRPVSSRQSECHKQELIVPCGGGRRGEARRTTFRLGSQLRQRQEDRNRHAC